LRLEAVGRNAFRVVFDRARNAAVVERWTRLLARDPAVEWAVPNERETALQAAVVPDDPAFGPLTGQWWLLPAGGSNANASEARLRGVPGFQPAWARTTGNGATVVAVLDTGVSAHPDLDPARLLPGYDMVSDWDAARGTGYANDGDGRDADPTDPGDWIDAADQAADPARYGACPLQSSDWHGTAVAGFLAAATDNGRGVAAATWAGRVLPVRVAGKCGAEVADIVDGMRWAAGLPVCRTWAAAGDVTQGCAQWAPVNPTPARIVNVSFGGAAACNAAYQDAIDELHALGVVVVAAGGNGRGTPTRPASCRGVVGVAALNRDGFKAVYSNFGAVLQIATVGGDSDEGAWGPLLGDGGLQGLGDAGTTSAGEPTYPRHVGTSFAAPIVAGTAALMLAADPSLGADELVAGLRASARPHVASPLLAACSAANPGRCLCSTATCGAGILDADQAVAFAQAHAAGQPWVAPTWPTPVLETAELARAVALGPDLPAGGDPASGARGPAAGGAGGGAIGALELALLACGAPLLAGGRRRVRSTRRAPAGRR
jgi:serine protease